MTHESDPSKPGLVVLLSVIIGVLGIWLIAEYHQQPATITAKTSNVSAAVASPLSTPTPQPHTALIYDNVLILVNEARIAAGVKPYPISQDLNDSAQTRSRELFVSGICTHDKLQERMKAREYPYYFVSENIACGENTAKQTVDDFMGSPTHRYAILSTEYNAIGIGIAGNVVVMHFANAQNLHQ